MVLRGFWAWDFGDLRVEILGIGFREYGFGIFWLGNLGSDFGLGVWAWDFGLRFWAWGLGLGFRAQILGEMVP